MLALTRGVDETIKIYTSDGVISVTVAAVRGGGQVRLAIHAPADVEIVRAEIEDTHSLNAQERPGHVRTRY